AAIESEAPRTRTRTKGSLADLAGWDVERAKAEGAVEAHQSVIEGRWGTLCAFFGAATEPRAVTAEHIQAYAAQRRAQGAKDVLRRELTDFKRGLTEAHRRRWISVVPPFPKVRSTTGTKRKGRYHEPDVIAPWLEA